MHRSRNNQGSLKRGLLTIRSKALSTRRYFLNTGADRSFVVTFFSFLELKPSIEVNSAVFGA